MTSKKILVTGGNGMIGMNIRDEIARSNDTGVEWEFIASCDVNLTQFDRVFEYFEKSKPTHVINLAAQVGGLYKNMREPVEFFERNILINMNVMHACRELGINNLISVMSTCIFPDATPYPIDETMLHLGPPHPSNECYSYSKRMIDVLSRAYNSEYGTKFVAVIPGNLYGKYDNFSLNDGHVIPCLLHKYRIGEEHTLKVMGSGAPLRQFTYAADVARILIYLADNFEGVSHNQSIILSTEEEVDIRTVAETILKLGDGGSIEFDISKSDGQYKKTISNSLLKSIMPDFEFTTFEEGMKQTYDWYVANETNVRI